MEEADRTRPDVVVMDVRLADGSGIEATREIRSRRPPTQVLMLTSVRDRWTFVMGSFGTWPPRWSWTTVRHIETGGEEEQCLAERST